MTKKKPKRVAKPRPLYLEGNGYAKCHRLLYNRKCRFIEMAIRSDLMPKNARRLKAWLPGAIAWCEEGSEKR